MHADAACTCICSGPMPYLICSMVICHKASNLRFSFWQVGLPRCRVHHGSPTLVLLWDEPWSMSWLVLICHDFPSVNYQWTIIHYLTHQIEAAFTICPASESAPIMSAAMASAATAGCQASHNYHRSPVLPSFGAISVPAARYDVQLLMVQKSCWIIGSSIRIMTAWQL